MTKVLYRAVSFIDETDGYVSYPAGTRASDMPDHHVNRISNPKAWEETSVPREDEDFVIIPAGMTKEQFIAAAKANFDTTGAEVEHFDDLDSKKVDELRDIADNEGVDLEGASRKADIIDRIRAVRNAGDE